MIDIPNLKPLLDRIAEAVGRRKMIYDRPRLTFSKLAVLRLNTSSNCWVADVNFDFFDSIDQEETKISPAAWPGQGR